MLSEYFRMYTASNATNWKGIIFQVTERGERRLQAREILPAYKNEI